MMATCPSSKMVLKSVSMITLGGPATAVTVTMSDIMPLRTIREIGILIILRWVFDGVFCLLANQGVRIINTSSDRFIKRDLSGEVPSKKSSDFGGRKSFTFKARTWQVIIIRNGEGNSCRCQLPVLSGKREVLFAR
jgi:hypothetical protein